MKNLYKSLKLWARIIRLFFSYNFFVAAGYWFGKFPEVTHETLVEALKDENVPYGRRLNYLLGYHFYLADLKRGYYGS